MRQILLATHNKAKLSELKLGIKQLEYKGYNIVTLADLHIHQDPEETGTTFEENALLKARFYSNIARIPTIADDGGLLIPSLNNEPGVKSKRWMGKNASDNELISYTLHKMSAFSSSQRIAYLETSLCFVNPKTGYIATQSARIKGSIAEVPSGKPTQGYPYRALFIVKKYNKYYDELTESEHLNINHRLKALKQLIQKIKTDLLQ